VSLSNDLIAKSRAQQLKFWIGFAGTNLIVVLTYFALWDEDRRRLPIILAAIPFQVVADLFLFAWRRDWSWARMGYCFAVVIVTWISWSSIRNREWLRLAAIAVGVALLILRIRRAGKRI
jgi:hypothetical protein